MTKIIIYAAILILTNALTAFTSSKISDRYYERVFRKLEREIYKQNIENKALKCEIIGLKRKRDYVYNDRVIKFPNSIDRYNSN